MIFKKTDNPKGFLNDLEKIWTASAKIATITEVSEIML